MRKEKNLLLTLLLFIFTALNSVIGQVAYDYTVRLGDEHKNKEILGKTLDPLNVTNRWITEEGFHFSSVVPYSSSFLYKHFAGFGIILSGTDSFKYESVSTVEEKAGGNNCDLAQLLCSGASLSGGTGGYGTQELGWANRGCLADNEHQSSWYYMNIQTGGSLAFTITPTNGTDDYDFAVWGPFNAASANANCPPVSSPVRCSYVQYPKTWGLFSGYCGTNTNPTGLSLTGTGTSQAACANVPFLQHLSVNAGEVYILLVDNYSSGGPYSLTFGGTSVLGCTSVVLPVELSEFKGTTYNEQNLIRWTTESEMNTKDFSVEWTTDPLSGNWQSIGRVDAGIFSKTQSHYSLLHAAPDTRQINYYRLVQRDQDGYEHIYSDRMIAMDNTSDRKVERIVDLMGREANELTPGIVIYVYDDGTTEKVFQQ